MGVGVPDYCFQVVCYSPKKKWPSSANGILVDREHGFFAVNEHFVSAGVEHFVVLPNTGTEHRLVVHKRLINERADVALVSLEDLGVLPNIELPKFADPPTGEIRRLALCGRQPTGERMRNVPVHFLQSDFFGWDYAHSIMFAHYSGETCECGLSGSPLLDLDGNVLGILTRGMINCRVNFATPSFEITRLLKKARSPSLGGWLRSWFSS